MICAAHSGRIGARMPGAGLVARPQRPTGRRGSSRPRRRSGAAYLGQSPGASARAGWRGKSNRAFRGVGAKPRAAPRARRAKGVAALLAVGSETARGSAVAFSPHGRIGSRIDCGASEAFGASWYGSASVRLSRTVSCAWGGSAEGSPEGKPEPGRGFPSPTRNRPGNACGQFLGDSRG